MDAFVQDWNNEVAWCCSPVNKIIPTIHKIEESVMLALLIVPAWSSAQFWPFLFPDGKHARKSVTKVVQFWPTVWRGKYCYNKHMQGKTLFSFLALYIRADGTGMNMTAGQQECPYIQYNSYR